MFKKIIREEEGFWSIIFLLLLTTLASLGMATYHAIKQSGSNAVNQTNVIKADYAATSAIYFGVQKAMAGETDSSWTARDLGIDAGVDISLTDDNTIELVSTGTAESAERMIRVEMSRPIDWSEVAIGAGGSIDRFNAYDSTGTVMDNSLMQEGVDIPEVDLVALTAAALAQQVATGEQRIYNSSLTIPNSASFPTTPSSFWYAPGVPNVTIIQNGDLKLSNYSVGYGIFVVMEGVVITDIDVTLTNKASVQGVIYSEGDVTSNGSHIFGKDVYGAIWAKGDIIAKGSEDVGHQVNYVADYVKAFVDDYVNTSGQTPSILSWEYL